MTNIITDFSLGLCIIPLLIMANVIVLNLCVTFPKYILGISGVMITIDAICVLGFTFIMSYFVTNLDITVGAIGLSIFIALLHKTITFQKTFKVMFADEIGN